MAAKMFTGVDRKLILKSGGALIGIQNRDERAKDSKPTAILSSRNFMFPPTASNIAGATWEELLECVIDRLTYILPLHQGDPQP